MAKASAFDTSTVPSLPSSSIPGLISEDEQKLYFFLSKSGFSPERITIEIGTWLGLSTLRVCQGLSEAGSDWRLLCYDRFEWTENYQRKTKGEFEHELRPGDSFEWKFRELLGGYTERVTTFRGDLQEIGTHMQSALESGAKIGSLFVDASKGWGGNVRLLNFMSPYFVSKGAAPTRLLFQDCLYFPAYKLLFLLCSLASLRPALYVDSGSSVVFEVVDDVSAEEIVKECKAPRCLGEKDIYKVWERILDYLPSEKLQQAGANLALPLMLWSCGFKEAAADEYSRVTITREAEGTVRRLAHRSSDRAIRNSPIIELLR